MGACAGSRDASCGRISCQMRNTYQALRVGRGLSLLILCCAELRAGGASNPCDKLRLPVGYLDLLRMSLLNNAK